MKLVWIRGVAVDGCTDSTVDNFNEYATNDDGSAVMKLEVVMVL